MSFKTLTLCGATTALLFTVLPAHAGTIEDMKTCRILLESKVDLNHYRLEFERKDGVTSSKPRILFIKAVGKHGRKSMQISCQLDKNYVVALRTDQSVLYAAR